MRGCPRTPKVKASLNLNNSCICLTFSGPTTSVEKGKTDTGPG